MVAWHFPTRSAISPGFAPFAYISSIIRRSSSFKHSYFIASPPFLRKKISASELISSFALNNKQRTQTAAVANKTKGEHIYVTKTGKRYHYSGTCNGGTYYEATLAEAMGRGLTPCDKCVLTKN